MPRASVVIASFNSAQYIEAAIVSALGQTVADLEVIVVDNCSSDGSFAIALDLARTDPRLRVFQTPANSGGPSVPRNIGIDNARGDWIAIMDSDDMMRPDRLRTLIERAERDWADIVADDLYIFSDGPKVPSSRVLPDDTEFWMNIARFIRSNSFYDAEVSLGLLKPVIRADWAKQIRYRPNLHMAEDFDYLARLLLRGARMKVYPDRLYQYRKHEGSISHRLSVAKLLPVLHYSLELMDSEWLSGLHSEENRRALNFRHGRIRRAIAFNRLVEAMKGRDVLRTINIGFRHPNAIPLLRLPFLAFMDRIRERLLSRC